MMGRASMASVSSSHSPAVASGAEMARSRSEARRAWPVAREPKTRTSRTHGKRRKVRRSTARSLSRRRSGFMSSVPLQSLDFARHGGEQGCVVADDAPVDFAGKFLIVGMAGEVAVFDHPEPAVGLLGSRDEVFGERLFYCGARPATLMPLAFEVEFE